MLDTGLEELQQKGEWSPEVVSELRRAIVEGTDLDLFRVNPVRYAATHSIDEAESIDLLLNAAAGDEVLITADVLEAPGVKERLRDFDLQPVSGAMKGAGDEIQVLRIVG